VNSKEAMGRMADYLEDYGWMQGQSLDWDHFSYATGIYVGPRCLQSVLDWVTWGGNTELYYDIESYLQAMTGDFDLAHWNDTPGRTKEEVITLLRS